MRDLVGHHSRLALVRTRRVQHENTERSRDRTRRCASEKGLSAGRCRSYCRCYAKQVSRGLTWRHGDSGKGLFS
jgi:hypothetical protein